MVGSKNTSYIGVREDLLALVPDAALQRILDVGCATGTTSACLKERFPTAHVTGVELDPALAEEAKERLDRVLVADAQEGLAQLEREQERFDLVLCGDVLEHLVDPWQALKRIRELTRGHLVISLPNVAHLSTFWALSVQGRWPYRERGIHDRTHLRFFAENNLPELFASAGFVEVTRRTNHRLGERPHPLNEKLSPLLSRVPLVRRFTAYQFLSVLRPA